ncbi:hypothetical protein GJAV_G00260270 [Gymnothorax javanicus]|nr:hypothetical protein GJAV_G00260270 [Gymnothorax javanicus]
MIMSLPAERAFSLHSKHSLSLSLTGSLLLPLAHWYSGGVLCVEGSTEREVYRSCTAQPLLAVRDAAAARPAVLRYKGPAAPLLQPTLTPPEPRCSRPLPLSSAAPLKFRDGIWIEAPCFSSYRSRAS